MNYLKHPLEEFMDADGFLPVSQISRWCGQLQTRSNLISRYGGYTRTLIRISSGYRLTEAATASPFHLAFV